MEKGLKIVGFVTFNQDERSNVNKVLDALKVEGTVDALGFGRIRDAFSDKMFPGTSTLHTHAKYFVMLPSLLWQAQVRRYKTAKPSSNEVRDAITHMEINMTQQLMNEAHKDTTPRAKSIGIIGSDTMVRAVKDFKKFVKSPPTIVYKSGMSTYGIIRTERDIYKNIADLAYEYASHPEKFEDTQTGERDSDDLYLSGHKSPIMKCEEIYDFSRSDTELSLTMTYIEARFLKERMERSCDALLTYILKNDVPIVDDYFSLGECWEAYHIPEKYLTTYLLSIRFSRFVHLLNLVYEATYAERTENLKAKDELIRRFEECISRSDYREASSLESINDVLKHFEDKNQDRTALYNFCRNGSTALTAYIAEPTHDNWVCLQNLVTKREKEAKGAIRSKLTHWENFIGVERRAPSPLTYRWEQVSTMINEIREGFNHGR